MSDGKPSSDIICIGEIVAPHGVRGAVKVRAYVEDPASLTAYGPVMDGKGKPLRLKIIGALKDAVICQIENVTTRNEAETMRGVSLYIRASQLPPLTDEIYHFDLVNYDIKTISGDKVGKIQSIENYGSSDLISVQTVTGKSIYIPYIDTVVKQVDTQAKIMIIDPIPGLLEPIKESQDDS